MIDPIKAKIQELCPDVMELKFGCEVDYHGIYIAKTPDDDEYYFAPKETDVNYEAQVFCVNSIDPKQILGSPITLAVVLRAIRLHGNPAIAVDGDGLFGILVGDKYSRTMLWPDAGAPRQVWNLEKDNFDDQSQGVKDFIGLLLK